MELSDAEKRTAHSADEPLPARCVGEEQTENAHFRFSFAVRLRRRSRFCCPNPRSLQQQLSGVVRERAAEEDVDDDADRSEKEKRVDEAVDECEVERHALAKVVANFVQKLLR